MTAVEDLDLADSAAAWVSEEAVLTADRECAEACRVGRGVSYRVQHLHVSYIVDVQRFLQAYYQSLDKNRTISATGGKAPARLY